MKNWKISNFTLRIRKLCRKMCRVSEFNFTLLPSAEVFSIEHVGLEQPRPQGTLFVAVSIFIAYLISSVPERPKFIFYYFSKYWLKNVKFKIVYYKKAFKVFYHRSSPFDRGYKSNTMLRTACSIFDRQFRWNVIEQFQLYRN